MMRKVKDWESILKASGIMLCGQRYTTPVCINNSFIIQAMCMLIEEIYSLTFEEAKHIYINKCLPQ